MLRLGSEEGASEYLAALGRLAKDCNFGAFLEEALRDRFVCGLVSESTRRRLLLEKELTLVKACEIVVAMEAADKDAATMQSSVGKINNNIKCFCLHTGHFIQEVNEVWYLGTTCTCIMFHILHYISLQSNTKSNSNKRRTTKLKTMTSRYCCGKNGHTPQFCKFKEAKCYLCGKTGHVCSGLPI